LAKATDAKTRILIYGSSGVLEALASLEKMGAVLDSPEAEKAFLALCNIMRKESLGKIMKTKPEALATILFRSKD